MRCWICGEEGNTGEHLIKASDLRYYFGDITNKEPVYFQKGEKSWEMQSANSKYVKSEAKICNSCNSNKTQPYDKDWEILSKYMQNNHSRLLSNGKIKISNVFPGRKSEAMLNVHLYFCKLFGCRLAAEDTPLHLEPFKSSINGTKPCANLYIEFGSWDISNKFAGITSIQALEVNGRPAVVFWFYIIGRVAVYVSYIKKLEITRLKKNCWHPSSITKDVSFRKFNT